MQYAAIESITLLFNDRPVVSAHFVFVFVCVFLYGNTNITQQFFWFAVVFVFRRTFIYSTVFILAAFHLNIISHPQKCANCQSNSNSGTSQTVRVRKGESEREGWSK